MTLKSAGFFSFACPVTASPCPSWPFQVDRRIEMTAADKLGVGDAFGCVSRIGMDNAIC